MNTKLSNTNKIDVSIMVLDYGQTQGINSVVDQFILNQDKFKQNGVNIKGVYDQNEIHRGIPDRKRFTNEALRSRLKNSAFFQSTIGQYLRIYNGMIMPAKRVAKSAKMHEHEQDILVSESFTITYYCIKRHIQCKIVHMTHMYDSDIEQLLINYPKIKGTIFEKRLRKKLAYCYNHADEIITICKHATQKVEKDYKPRIVKTVYNTVKVDKEKEQTGDILSKLNFVIASSLSKRKGMDVFLSMLCKYNDELSKDCEFHIYGEGDYLDIIKKAIGDNGWNNVYLYGVVNKPYTYYNKMDVFLLPSRNETLPMGILEAMSLKMPIVATNVGAVDEMIDNYKNGILVNPKEDSLHEGIVYMLSHKDKLTEMGLRSRQIFEEKYSQNVWVSGFVGAFNEVLDGK